MVTMTTIIPHFLRDLRWNHHQSLTRRQRRTAMNRAQALSKLNRSDMRNAAAERGTQRIFAWNRAHWIGMVVLIAVLLLLQWSSSMYLMPDEVLDRAAKNLFVWFPGMVLHWPLVLGITNLILGSTRSGSLSFPLASAIIGPLAFGWTNLRLRPGFPYRSWAQGKAAI